MYGVCLRYSGNVDDANDLLQEGFIKVFRNLLKFRGDGSFEGWMRRMRDEAGSMPYSTDHRVPEQM